MKAKINAIIVRKEKDLRDIVEEIILSMSRVEVKLDKELHKRFFLEAVDILGREYEIAPNEKNPSTVFVAIETKEWQTKGEFKILYVRGDDGKIEALKNPKRVMYFRLEE